jgi:hypothetical protein
MIRHVGRAVKANDSKSFDVSRVGSSPARVAYIHFCHVFALLVHLYYNIDRSIVDPAEIIDSKVYA